MGQLNLVAQTAEFCPVRLLTPTGPRQTHARAGVHPSRSPYSPPPAPARCPSLAVSLGGIAGTPCLRFCKDNYFRLCRGGSTHMCEGTPLTVKLATGGHPRKVSKLGLPNFQQMCYGQQGSWIRRDGLTWNQSPLFESQLHRSTSALGLPPTSVPACP